MEGFVDYVRTERDTILLARASNYIAVNNLSTTNVIVISSSLNRDSAGIKYFQIINKFYYTTLKYGMNGDYKLSNHIPRN